MLSGEKMAPLAERRRQRDVKGALEIKVPARGKLMARKIEGTDVTIVDRRRGIRSNLLQSRDDEFEVDDDSSDDEHRAPVVSNNPTVGGGNTVTAPPDSPDTPDTPKFSTTLAAAPQPAATTTSIDTPSPTTVSFTSTSLPPPPPPQIVRPTSIPLLQPAQSTTSSIRPVVTSISRAPPPIIAAPPPRTTPPPPPTVVTSFIPIMTTAPVENISASQPRKGIQPIPITTSSSDTPSPTTTSFSESSSSTSAFIVSGSNLQVTQTALPDTDGGIGRMREDPPRRGLDPTAEHLLIAAGAIGAFILFCFIGWIVLRTLKKSGRRSSGYMENTEGGSGMGRGGGMGLFDKLPWRRNENAASWSANDTFARSMPPTYNEKTGSPVSYTGSEAYYGTDKALPYVAGDYRRTLGSQSQYSQNTLSQPPQGLMKEPSTQSIIDQYGASATMGPNGTLSSDVNLTMRSRMPDPFYNQSELARQPSDAYDPNRRQVYRASELSSISSGFGDGDIIIPPDAAAQPQMRSNSVAGRFSWMSRGSRRERETVYTQSSEDQPPRFRTVTSWVDQQAGRVKRGHQATPGEDDVPALPGVPNEDRYLGLNDGEVARKVDENRMSGTTIMRADELLQKRGA